MNLKIFLIGILSFLSICICNAQVRGIPSKNLFGLSASTNDLYSTNGSIKYSYLSSDKYFDGNGLQKHLFATSDSLYVESSITVIVSYQISDRLETGIEIPVNDNASFMGFKYLMNNDPKHKLSFVSSLKLPLGINSNDPYNDRGFGLAMGFTYDQYFNRSTSINLNTAFSTYSKSNLVLSNKRPNIWSSIDFNQYLFSKRLLVLAGVENEVLIRSSSPKLELLAALGVAYCSNATNQLSLNYKRSITGKNVMVFDGIEFKIWITMEDKSRKWLRESELN